MTHVLRPDFSELDPFLQIWGLPSSADRVARRATSSIDDLNAFYDAMLPRLEEVITYLNQFPPHEIPAADKPLADAALAMCEVDNAVRKWQAPTLSSGVNILGVIEKKTLYDSRSA